MALADTFFDFPNGETRKSSHNAPPNTTESPTFCWYICWYKMALTDIAIRRLSNPGKHADGRGLYLHVWPTGGKYWRVAYRFGGKQKVLSLGTYPDVGLARARELLQKARSQLAEGLDPGALKKAAKLARANTFGELASEWLKRQTLKPSTRSKLEGWLENECSALARLPIKSISAGAILDVARSAEHTSADKARRIVAMCGQIIRFAIAGGTAERDPTADLKGALARPPSGNFTAITNPEQLAMLMRAIQASECHPLTVAALKLSALTFTRPGELRGALWTEIEGDTWTIPASRMKMGRDHIVPLSRQALAILQTLPRTSTYVLPMQKDSKRPMAANTVADAVRKMGFHHTAHGFRATARTILDEVLGERVDLIEHQLSHAVKDPNGRAYNRTTHLQARREMMQRWADYLDKLGGSRDAPHGTAG